MTSIMRHAISAHAGCAGLRRDQLTFEQSDSASAFAVGGEASQINRMTTARLAVVESNLLNDGEVVSIRDVVRVASVLRGGHFDALASDVPVGAHNGAAPHDGKRKWKLNDGGSIPKSSKASMGNPIVHCSIRRWQVPEVLGGIKWL